MVRYARCASGGFNIKAFTALTTLGPAAAFCLCRFSLKSTKRASPILSRLIK